jgi:hypothetical protein
MCPQESYFHPSTLLGHFASNWIPLWRSTVHQTPIILGPGRNPMPLLFVIAVLLLFAAWDILHR